MRTDRQRTNKQTENSITEATLIPVDCGGERANSEAAPGPSCGGL